MKSLVSVKNLFMAASAAFVMVLSFAGCDKSGKENDPGTDILESSWSKECAKYPFLKDFPSYDYDFQGSYMEALGTDTYVLADRAGSEEKLKEYKAKFVKAGFTEKAGEFETSYTKTSDKGKWLASLSFEPMVKTLTASYMFEPAE